MYKTPFAPGVLVAFLLSSNSAWAQVHVGMALGIPREYVTYTPIVLGAYVDYIRPSEGHVTWLAGTEGTWMGKEEEDAPYTSLSCWSISLRGGPVLELGGVYMSAGPALMYYRASASTPGTSGGGGVLSNCNGLSGMNLLECETANSGGQYPGTAGSDSSSSQGAFGGYVLIGYQGRIGHVEVKYEVEQSGSIRPGGVLLKLGLGGK